MAQDLKKLREDALAIFRAGLEAASPENGVRNALGLEDEVLNVGSRRYDLRKTRGVILLGAGKASRRMAVSTQDVLGGWLKESVLSVPRGEGGVFNQLRLLEASHPIPDENGLANTREIMRAAREAGKDSLILFFVSGGASSLLVAPPNGIGVRDIADMNRVLLSCGADIRDANTVRKHVSEVKGGRLAEKAYPASFATLIVSDVPGDDPTVIGSGPTVPDPTTYRDAQRIVEELSLENRMPNVILGHLRRGVDGQIVENPDDKDPVFADSQTMVIASNTTSVAAACARAEKMGYRTLSLGSSVTGDTQEAAQRHVQIATQISRGRGPIGAPACVVSGGETTVKVQGGGKGGRNQEFVLHAAMEIEGMPIVVLSADTDGRDGTTDVAGAICDGKTLEHARERRMGPASYLYHNDSYDFFHRLGDLVSTGSTGTNVMDIHVMIIGK